MQGFFWVKRFATVFAGAFATLLVVELVKGHPVEAALEFAATWGAIAGAVFAASAYYRWRKGQACALCGDPPVAGADKPGP
jgi:hypothetical protein